jgi:hypothetical protein
MLCMDAEISGLSVENFSTQEFKDDGSLKMTLNWAWVDDTAAARATIY